MGQVFGERVLWCSEGHLFISEAKQRLFGSVHLGPNRYIFCPVCRRGRMAGNVIDPTPAQLEEARRNTV